MDLWYAEGNHLFYRDKGAPMLAGVMHSDEVAQMMACRMNKTTEKSDEHH